VNPEFHYICPSITNKIDTYTKAVHYRVKCIHYNVIGLYAHNITFQRPVAMDDYLICKGGLEAATSCRVCRLLVCHVVASLFKYLYKLTTQHTNSLRAR
jgi:hypothetical protein